MWIDRLFARLAALYGKHWLELWADVPMDDVKDAWRDALHGVTAGMIRSALEHCQRHNTFPPTCPEFVSLCRQFRPGPGALRLTDQRRDGPPGGFAAIRACLRQREPGDDDAA